MENRCLLIYEASSRDKQLIEFVGKEFGFETFLADNEMLALKYLEDREVNLIFANESLPKLEIKKETRVVIITEDQKIKSRTTYRAVDFLHKPFDRSEVHFCFQKLLNDKIIDFPSLLVKHIMIIKDCIHRFSSVLSSEELSMTIEKSIQDFCFNACPYGIKASDIPEGEKGNYALIAISFDREEKRCKRISDCELKKFTSWVREVDPEFLHVTINDLLVCEKAALQKNIQTILSSIRDEYVLMIKKIMTRQKEYCMEHCEDRKEGIEFKKGDILISEWADLLKNQCVYCSKDQCSLHYYLNIFQKKLAA